MRIAAWGDSMTSIGYPTPMHILTGIDVYNGGVGGETSYEVKARMLAATDKHDWETIIWVGRNNIGGPIGIKNDIAEMVAALTTTKYTILGVTNRYDEPINSTNWNIIVNLNNDLAALYGDKFIDIRRYWIDQYDPNIPQDVLDFNNDLVPIRFLLDIVHPNSLGNSVITKKLINHNNYTYKGIEMAGQLKSQENIVENQILSLMNDIASNDNWERPADWLALPTVLASDQKFAGLFAVFDTDSSLVAFTATGDFTVDWGDGSATENIASGVTAEHKYTYASISNATLSTRGYKQVIITITPNNSSLLSVVLDKRHSAASTSVQRVPWLDIICSCDPVSNIGFTVSGSVAMCSLLEQATILNGQLRTSFQTMFYSCSALQSVPLFDTSAGTNFQNMFSTCSSLQSVPLFNTSSGTNFQSMFANCGALELVPLFNTSLGTNFSSMFNKCYSLRSAPALNTSSGTNFSLMFNTCPALKTIPLLNTAAGNDFSLMFNACSALQTIPAFNTQLGTNFTSMFSGCSSLQSLPAFNFSAVLDSANLGSFVTNAYGLSRSLVTNVPFTHSYANCNLSATAIDEIFTNLPTVVGQTITVTGNPGAATCTQSIATAKGWTVVV